MNKLEVDESLTPENCEERGYEWWKDTTLDPEEPDRDDTRLIQLIEEEWKLGKPASRGLEQHHGIGLYKPLEDSSSSTGE